MRGREEDEKKSTIVQTINYEKSTPQHDKRFLPTIGMDHIRGSTRS